VPTVLDAKAVCVVVLAAFTSWVAATAGAQAQAPAPSAHPSGILGANDHRVPISPDTWPWSSIGRINVVQGPAHRGFCTASLIGPRHVLTAAHCLFDTRLNTFVKPAQVHFVAGQSRSDKFQAHSVAESFVTSPDFHFSVEERPRYDQIRADMIRNDWAIIRLQDALDLKPIPLHAFAAQDLPHGSDGGEIARAGYSVDRPFLLSIHRGCSAKTDLPQRGDLASQCDSMPGDSGSPILLLDGDSATIVGIHTVAVQSFESGVGYTARGARGVSASAFEKAAADAVAK
jgi:protease YdgD